MRDVSSGSGTGAAQPVSPTVGRRWLAQEIRRLRENAGLKQGDVAARLRCAQGKIAHMESMRNAISGPDLEIMLPFFGVPAERIGWYLQLADVAKQKGWWDGNQAIPDWFSLYVGLEWGASEIREWDLGFIPGILQTRAYAEAVLGDDLSVSEERLAKQAEARLRRRDALTREDLPLFMHAIIDEAALRRVIGGERVMVEQIQHLLEFCASPHVIVQVMTFDRGPHRGQLGSFHLLDFANADDRGVVYVENQAGGTCLEEVAEVESFRQVFEELTMKALSITDSEVFLRELAKDLA
ncbi:helix-turn-helix transcriptional regulator [Saccharopolyspora gloriosae]|uniref:Transcriptional regulator with XRE-family HTH domain n=1 Tax=Saccharopolyspora gloriosae TaxID=455344 RepID=A0A840N8V6_9PSEU|nr:helix-turn-helix transcriptional regulator [Saccharopolyspora gloriosae]MBB5068400.1 transcriptional regulator with XRE-family HTH domain [Saccharopolyspora gloriosae]